MYCAAGFSSRNTTGFIWDTSGSMKVLAAYKLLGDEVFDTTALIKLPDPCNAIVETSDLLVISQSLVDAGALSNSIYDFPPPFELRFKYLEVADARSKPCANFTLI